MNLSEKPDLVHWTDTHFVFVEEMGPFQDSAPKAWASLHKNLPQLANSQKISRFFSAYRVQPEMRYRAGVGIGEEPASLPDGFKYEKLKGGKYARFVLKGSYSQLPEASGKVFEAIEKQNIPVRDAFFIENYANDPQTTAESELITEILIPVH